MESTSFMATSCAQNWRSLRSFCCFIYVLTVIQRVVSTFKRGNRLNSGGLVLVQVFLSLSQKLKTACQQFVAYVTCCYDISQSVCKQKRKGDWVGVNDSIYRNRLGLVSGGNPWDHLNLPREGKARKPLNSKKRSNFSKNRLLRILESDRLTLEEGQQNRQHEHQRMFRGNGQWALVIPCGPEILTICLYSTLPVYVPSRVPVT